MTSVLGPLQLPTAESLVEGLGISRNAAQLYLSSDVIDLHVESFSFVRSLGYDLYKRHTGGVHRALLVGQADIPRLLEAGVTGATWVITANPLRPPEGRGEVFDDLLRHLTSLLRGADGHIELVCTAEEYRRARSRGKQAAWLGVQGANALPPDPGQLERWADLLLRITLLHLTPTQWGQTSSPSLFSGDTGLSDLGHEFIERMNELRIGVDLAHIHPRGFWDAVQVSDPSVPLLVTHTGVSGVFPHWRNLDDRQCRAIADRGGTIGVMYHSLYLGDGLFRGKMSTLVRHIQHLLDIVGDDHVSLGSDWDGLICTPRDMPTCLELPLLIDAMLEAGIGELSIEKILGGNFLRVVRELKGR